VVGPEGGTIDRPLAAIITVDYRAKLVKAGVSFRPAMVLNRLDTIVAMVEAGHGTGIIPSFALPACQRCRVRTSRLVNPTVPVDFYQIRSRSRKLSAAAEEFTTFLRAYIAHWAGRAGLP
jgi:DNA-binding transcriptional LysR family regulator